MSQPKALTIIILLCICLPIHLVNITKDLRLLTFAKAYTFGDGVYFAVVYLLRYSHSHDKRHDTCFQLTKGNGCILSKFLTLLWKQVCIFMPVLHPPNHEDNATPPAGGDIMGQNIP